MLTEMVVTHQSCLATQYLIDVFGHTFRSYASKISITFVVTVMMVKCISDNKVLLHGEIACNVVLLQQ